MNTQGYETISTDNLTQHNSTETAPSRIQKVWRNSPVLLILLGILLMGGYFRFNGLNWDAFTHLHPDERFLTIVTTKLESESSFLGYLRTSTSQLNPYNHGEGLFVYGNFPMTVTFYAGEWADKLQPTICERGWINPESVLCTSRLTSYDGIHFIGRIMSASVDLLAVLFTFMIGRRLYGKWAGLVGAFFMATAVMAIQQSHFYTMDNWATLFTAVTIYFAVRASENSVNLGWWALLGISLGLAVASRINVAPVALSAGVAGIVWFTRRYHINRRIYLLDNFGDFFWSRTGWFDLQTIFIGGMIAALISMVIFRLAMPYAFADGQMVREIFREQGRVGSTVEYIIQSTFGLNPQWRGNMQEIQRLQAPEAAFPPALQWTDRPAILFPLTNMFLYGMGPLAALLAWLGVCFALWRTVSGKRDWLLHAIPLFWTLFYFLFIGTRWVKSIRYFLPIYPTLFVLAGWFTVWAIQRLYVRYQHRTKNKTRNGIALGAFGSLVALAVLSSFLWAYGFTNIYREPMTRVAASDWIFDNVPTAVTIGYLPEGSDVEKSLNLPLRDTTLFPGEGGFIIPFEMPERGTVQSMTMNYVTAEGELDRAAIQLSINGRFDESFATGGEAIITGVPSRESIRLDVPPARLEANQRHQLYMGITGNQPVRLETSIISGEHWDDPLPTRVPGRDPYGQYFRGLADGPMETTHPDSDDKKIKLYSWIREADYIVLSSQRSLWSLPRLPITYPLMIHYYDGLFNGDLGFELVAEFHGDVGIGPIDVNDTTGQFGWGDIPVKAWPPPGFTAAEEAFSVYDHPPVWVFKKSDAYDDVKAAQYLAEVSLTTATFQNPLEATQSPNGLNLPAVDQKSQQAGGTWSEVFNPAGLLSNNGVAAAVVWWIVVILLGLLNFPLSFAVFKGLSGRGYAVSRILSVLLLSWLVWLAASVQILPNNRSSYLIMLIVIWLVNFYFLVKHWTEISEFVQDNKRHFLKLELIGLCLYLFMLGVRLMNPDVWHIIWGGEKPMDMSYFTAVLKSTSFPPYDPWHAGGFINYYYYGFVYTGAITKLLRVVPGVAYNLILPMLFSFTGLAIFSVTHTLINASAAGRNRLLGGRVSAPTMGGMFATLTALILGNLSQLEVVTLAAISTSRFDATTAPLIRFGDGLFRMLVGNTPAMRPDHWFWNATRLITFNEGEVQPITEFPYFTFLYGDLHAHMIALPLSVLAIAWSISLVMRPNQKMRWENWLVGAVAIGVLYPTNSWDYPTYMVIGILALVFVNLKRHGLTLTMVGRLLVQATFLFGISRLAFQPFWSNFGTAYSTIKLWPGSYTPVSDFLVIYGLFLIVVITWLFADLRSWAGGLSQKTLEEAGFWMLPAILFAFAFVVLFVVGYLLGYALLPLVATLIVFSGLLALRPSITPERRIINTLIASAMGLVLFVEIFVLDGDIGRMNTVFKFYMQVWIMLSIVTGVSLVWVLNHIQMNWSATGQTLWRASFAGLVTLATLYPISATFAKRTVRTGKEIIPVTLDGTKFMEYVTYEDEGTPVVLRNDFEAIQWIQENISGSPVIAEAHGSNPYRSVANRVAMYTGLPTIIGWDWHQRQQRPTVPDTIVRSRISDVRALYTHQSIDVTMRLIRQYDVSYIYHGELEKIYYGESTVDKFDQMVTDGYLEQVYSENGVFIYKIISSDQFAQRQ